MIHVALFLFFAFFPCSAKRDAAVASSRLRVELPPVPAYPSDGKIPAELQDRFVFLNEDTGDLVVSFPASLDTENPDRRQQERLTETVELAIATCPSLSVVIEGADYGRKGAYEYRYQLRNRSEGRQPIGKWSMPLPGRERVTSMLSPYGWGVEDWEEPDLETALEAKSASWGDAFRERIRQSMLLRQTRWYAQLSEYAIETGNILGPFGFTTDARPGIVRAYVQALTYKIATRSRLPEPVGHQLWAFNFEENNSLSISTIGPKFSPNADKMSIASDFMDSIKDLIQRGELPGESKFLREALGRLEAVAEGAAGIVDPAAWPAKPETDFEREIRSAILFSLRD